MDSASGTGTWRRWTASSFAVDPGELVAILGHNGAGKTTTVEMLEGHRRRDGGRLSVLGLDPETGGRALRRRIGIVLQEAGLDPAAAELARTR